MNESVWRIARLKLTKNTNNVHKNSLNELLAEVWWRACTKTSASVMNPRLYLSSLWAKVWENVYRGPFAVCSNIYYYLLFIIKIVHEVRLSVAVVPLCPMILLRVYMSS